MGQDAANGGIVRGDDLGSAVGVERNGVLAVGRGGGTEGTVAQGEAGKDKGDEESEGDGGARLADEPLERRCFRTVTMA